MPLAFVVLFDNSHMNSNQVTNETETKPARTMRPIYREIACACSALKRCEASGNDYAAVWIERLRSMTDMLPSGSGIDRATRIDIDASGDDKIVLMFDYHHMNDNGYYDGWTEHKAIITPSFSGFDLKITGPNKRDIKDYLREVFSYALDQLIAI